MLQERLKQAAEGLVYSSEGDYPFEFFFLPGGGRGWPLAVSDFAARLGVPAGTPLGETTLDRFLAHHIETSDPWDTRAQAIRPRYERLKALLRQELRSVRVFRIGEVQVQCYIVGRDAHDNLFGLHTLAIET